MDKENMVCVGVCVYTYIYIYKTQYYSAIKKNESNAIYNNMDGTPDYHSK